MKDIESNLKRANLLAEKIGYDKIWNIEVTRYEIAIMAYANSGVESIVESIGFAKRDDTHYTMHNQIVVISTIYKDDPLADAIIRLNEKLDKDKLSLYVRPLSERETKLEWYKEGTTQLRQREGEFARAFARDGRRLVTSSGFKAANESRQAGMLEDLISKLRQKTYKEGPIARTLAEAQRAQRLQKAQRPQ